MIDQLVITDHCCRYLFSNADRSLLIFLAASLES
jgi:hypothetical protein